MRSLAVRVARADHLQNASVSNNRQVQSGFCRFRDNGDQGFEAVIWTVYPGSVWIEGSDLRSCQRVENGQQRADRALPKGGD